MPQILEGLNDQQKAAVRATEGPVLVLAGPGSGKTRVLTRRIAYLIEEKKIDPWHVLAVTFTNKAAKEMGDRVEELIGHRFPPPAEGRRRSLGGLTIGTFHSVCARVLRVEVEAAGFQRNWVIYDSADQLALVREVMKEMQLDEKRFSPRAVLSQIGGWKNDLLTPDLVSADGYMQEICDRVYGRYQQLLRLNNAMDFDDLLMHAVLLLRKNKEVRRKYQDKWRYVLVDEFQDTNTAQYELASLFVGPPDGRGNLFVVGDEDQSIYRFRGADYRNVLQFRRDHPAANVVLLEQNYRSTQNILDVANAVIAKNPNRTPKRLRTDLGSGLKVTIHEAYNEVEEAEYVLDEAVRLSAQSGVGPGGAAVVYRTNAQSRALEEACVYRNLRYRLVGATRFYERREIKDVLAYLRLVQNPSATMALDRIINVPPRGIGARTYELLKGWAASGSLSEWQAMQTLISDGRERDESDASLPHLPPAPFAPRARNALIRFASLLNSWVRLASDVNYEDVAALLDRILTDSGYLDRLRDGSDEGEERFENINELRAVAAQYRPGLDELEPGQDPLGLFLQEISLVSEQDDYEENDEALTLMTLHTAKGLEFPVVFMVGMEEGLLPHARSIGSEDEEEMAEERRLAYVGITRAKHRLYLVHASQRAMWGNSESQAASRFLDDIPAELLSGSVDRRSRQAAVYDRATSWLDGPASFGRYRDSNYVARGEATAYRTTSRSIPDRPQARRTRRRPTATDAPTLFKRRQSVEHPKFGVGMVIDSVVISGEEEVSVAFPNLGVKKFMASLANLKIL
ncbi:MAG: UvrD-helicase domain-containing protein [Caldilineaceae bacterium]|nr:UvrD-helicase domain-containing protein [Caldilineaceae bacterium]